MPEKDVKESLRQLARDVRFAAVVSVLLRYERAWSSAVSDQAIATDHGKLAHAAGSLYGLRVLQQAMAGIIDPPRPDPQEAES